MVINEINVLREKLENQILENDSYDNIYTTSLEIDSLITEYYKIKDLSKRT